MKFHDVFAALYTGFDDNFLPIQQISMYSCWLVIDAAFVRPAHISTATNFPPAGLYVLNEVREMEELAIGPKETWNLFGI